MKARHVDLSGAREPHEVLQRIIAVRLAEAIALEPELATGSKVGLHAFRIACKRLRYALERFAALEPPFTKAADCLAALQDALGDAHDRDVLLAILPPSMATTERKLKSERHACVENATRLWSQLEQMMQALDSHRI